jgi:hypothetical protein
VHGMIDPGEPRLRREELLHEAELYRLKKAVRANREGSAISRWASAVSWELIRAAGLLRKFFGVRKNTG